MARKRRTRSKDELRMKQLLRRSAKESGVIVKLLADRLQFPTPEADLVGEQEHFLRRIERLPDEVQGLAIRLYYSYELRRFVAREGLGVRHFEVAPADLDERRVAVALEPGSTPSRVILDGRGKVITCLAPDMALGSGTRISYREFVASVERFKDYQRDHVQAREAAESTDLFRYYTELAVTGWLTPREQVEALAGLGPAGGVFVSVLLRPTLIAAHEAFVQASRGGSGNDLALRRWFRHSGQAAAYLATLAGWGVAPNLELVVEYLKLHDPVVSMVIGACLARWRPVGAYELVSSGLGAEGEDSISKACAMLVYFGALRRLHLASGEPPEAGEHIFRWFAEVRDSYENELEERRRLGLPISSIQVFCRDLLLLARGGRPEWGDDLVDDPDALPPLRLDDLCLPGNETSPRALRILAQRLLAVERPLWQVFMPAADLGQWSERLGPLDEVRRGEFCAPWMTPNNKPPLVRADLPGRNEPCPCGSGKKFKRCCLPMIEAGEDGG